jgi:L-cysteine S-thiosulfotransferase
MQLRPRLPWREPAPGRRWSSAGVLAGLLVVIGAACMGVGLLLAGAGLRPAPTQSRQLFPATAWAEGSGRALSEHPPRPQFNGRPFPASATAEGAQLNVPPSPYIVEDRRSGYTYLSEENQRLQDDDFANPGLLWVEQGRALWQQPDSATGTSCASCHGDATASMRGVRTRYPRFDPQRGKLINLEQQINSCREQHMQASPSGATVSAQGAALPYESEALLALTTFVGWQSRGLPMHVSIDGQAQPFFEAGKAFYMQRRGQLDLACTHCHDQYAGQRLRGDVISQGQSNGFPIYRHTWQTLGSTHRMFAWCNTSVRAEPYPLGADEYVNLELFVAWRGRGLPVETPAVRR